MKRGLEICIIFLIVINLVNMSILIYPKSQKLTGALTTASVGLTILETRTFNITSPLNITYNFATGDPYTIELNVTPKGFEEGGTSWTYTLWDLRNNATVNDSVAFLPNITFNAVRWENLLIVYADFGDSVITSNVSFSVNVSDSSPILGAINSSIYVCENKALDYWFNVTDNDEQSLYLTLAPSNPFYITPEWTTQGVSTTPINLYSGVLDKTDATDGVNGWKIYEETIEVTDQTYSDSAYTNITAIEINNAPVISTIGVQTVQTKGDDSTFYKEVGVTDKEDGNQSSGNLSFNISFSGGEDLFNITNDGIMNFTPNSSQIGVYNISICVNDTGIDSPYENISLCGQDGSSITTCQNFSLTVTNENRAPTITNYYPGDLNLNVSGTESLYFNITKYDADSTIPDTYWYVDNVLKEYDSNSSLTDEFTYSFGCGVSGAKEIKAEITDGLLNDSVTWAVDVSSVLCPVPSAPSGRGSGGGVSCDEKWGCSIWSTCQNTEKSLEVGLLSGEDYRIIKKGCMESNLAEETCGVQIRTCSDINSCDTNYLKPSEFQSCHYTERPSCEDGIKNCHDDSCELLVDCGGPCSPCPTCSDKIKNQGEEGVDCGGPCPWKCPEEIPLLKRPNVLYSFLIIILLDRKSVV